MENKLRLIPPEFELKRSKIFETLIKPNLLKMLKFVDLRTFQVLVKYKANFKAINEIFNSCYFYGNVGSGKTVESAWYMLEWARLKCLNGFFKKNIYFIVTEDLLQEIRNCYNKNSEFTEKEIMDKYKKCDLLILDEFILEKTTEWCFKILYMIINYRYKHLLPTIYTSNLSLNQIGVLLEDHKIPSRIEQDCGENIFHFTGKSKRKKLKS